MLIKLRAELREAYGDGEGRANQWSEFVADLWSAQLSHLREETFGEGEFVFDPTTGRYGFEDESDRGSEEGFILDLENDLYEGEEVEGGDFLVNLADEDSFAEVIESGLLSQAQVTHSYDLSKYSDEELSEEEEEHVEPEEPKPTEAEDHLDCKYSFSSTFFLV